MHGSGVHLSLLALGQANAEPIRLNQNDSHAQFQTLEQV